MRTSCVTEEDLYSNSVSNWSGSSPYICEYESPVAQRLFVISREACLNILIYVLVLILCQKTGNI